MNDTGGWRIEAASPSALLVRADRDRAIGFLALAAELPAEPERVALVVATSAMPALRARDTAVVWELLRWLGPGAPTRAARGVRLVMSASDAEPLAQWLADVIDADVVTPTGMLIAPAPGRLFVTGKGQGWGTIPPSASGATRHFEGPRHPAPAWQSRVEDTPRTRVTAVPAGVCIHPADAPPAPGSAPFAAEPDPGRVTVFVTGGDVEADLLELAQLVFAPGSPAVLSVLDGGGWAQWLADQLGREVPARHGVSLRGSDGAVQTWLTDGHGRPTWPPFLPEAVYRPGGAEPAPVHWFPPGALPAVGRAAYALPGNWCVEAVSAGLWIRPSFAAAAEQPHLWTDTSARQLPPDSETIAVIVAPGAPAEALTAIRELLAAMPTAVTGRVRFLVPPDTPSPQIACLTALGAGPVLTSQLLGPPARVASLEPAESTLALPMAQTAATENAPKTTATMTAAPVVHAAAAGETVAGVVRAAESMTWGRSGELVVLSAVVDSEGRLRIVVPEADTDVESPPQTEDAAVAPSGTTRLKLSDSSVWWEVGVPDGPGEEEPALPPTGPGANAEATPGWIALDEDPTVEYAAVSRIALDTIALPTVSEISVTATGSPAAPPTWSSPRRASPIAALLTDTPPTNAAAESPQLASEPIRVPTLIPPPDLTPASDVPAVPMVAGPLSAQHAISAMGSESASVMASASAWAASTASETDCVAESSFATADCSRPFDDTGTADRRSEVSGIAAVVLPRDTHSTPAERQLLRVALGWRYDASAREVVCLLAERPGMRALTQEADAVFPDLVAIRTFLERDSVASVAALRNGHLGTDAALYACLTSGLQRVPSYRGAAFGVAPGAAQQARDGDLYPVGALRWEPAPLVTAPSSAPGDAFDLEFVLLASTARRCDDFASPLRPTVVFGPGTTFGVLATEDTLSGGYRVYLTEVRPGDLPSWRQAVVPTEKDAQGLARLRAATVRPEAAATTPGTPPTGAVPLLGIGPDQRPFPLPSG